MLARLALAQAFLYAGNHSGVLETIRNHEPDGAKYPESRWKALALMSQADPAYAAPAQQALREIERLWGHETFEKYLTRPDVQRLSRPFLRAISAVQ
jgi:hypothetical protein